MATELRPCPFCGGEAEINFVPPFVHPRNGRKGLERWQIFCDSCGVFTPGMLTKEEAIEAWNRRVEDDCN